MVAEQVMLQYDCAFVDDGQPVGTGVCGTPVVGEIANLPELRKSYGLLVAGIGNNNFRCRYMRKLRQWAILSRISSNCAYVSPYAKLGNGCVILQNACVQNGSRGQWRVAECGYRNPL